MRKLSLFLLALFVSQAAQAQIVADPTSPILDDLCPAAVAAFGPGDLNGEMPPWVAGSGRPLVRFDLAPSHPAAICNDGTTAAMFVRPAPATLPTGQPNPLVGAWHIHLKGGGSCDGFKDCAERFCKKGSKATDVPGLMSSRGWHDKLRGNGLFADVPRNRFSDMNQVLVGYCSSDTWHGSTDAGTAVSIDPADDPAFVSNIAFQGEAIVNAVLDTLDTAPSVAIPGDDRTYNMPALSDARNLLITGDSGGASGVRYHIDRIAARYGNTFTFAMLDAGGTADMNNPGIDWSLMPTPTTFEDFMTLRVEQKRSFHGVEDTGIDASCKAANPGSGFDEQACFNGYELSRDHITTPMLQRNSLGDSTTVKSLEPMVAPPAGQTVRQMAYDGAQALIANPDYSVLAANCGRHVTFRNNRQVANMETLSGGPRLIEELDLWAFTCMSAGTCPKMVILAPPAVPGVSTCP